MLAEDPEARPCKDEAVSQALVDRLGHYLEKTNRTRLHNLAAPNCSPELIHKSIC